ncbi:MAG: cytochrome c [Notoacmeibacter sp.]|nr:cytochrome c [Notoacmeibacter sp.]
MREAAIPLALALLAGSISPAAAGNHIDAAVAASLANTVRQDCGSCHGLTLKGGLGRPITAEALAGYEVHDLRDIILHGIPGTAMPPWQGMITEDEAEWIARRLIEGSLE